MLKPWILPTGNAFIKNPAKHHTRPDGKPGDVSYTQRDFDDSSWRQLNLPHDWAIEGPFNVNRADGVGGGMGRLPSPGIGWYRKKLDIPASDAGKSIFLDVDGAMSYAMVWLNGQLVGGWPYGYASGGLARRLHFCCGPLRTIPFQSHDRKAFNGLCLVIVRGKAGQPGKLTITAKADGLNTGTASIETTMGQP